MKYLLLTLINWYWFLIPESKRRRCIFKKSCSNHVYDITKEKGFSEGIRALRFRFENCRAGFEIFTNPVDNKTQVILPSKIIVDSEEIADRIVTN
jgi:putative component of membrane protein insertase Oxa1/YidC/SpoIIIJ protein YidD